MHYHLVYSVPEGYIFEYGFIHLNISTLLPKLTKINCNNVLQNCSWFPPWLLIDQEEIIIWRAYFTSWFSTLL